jgi:preprotein translocase subunit YajC
VNFSAFHFDFQAVPPAPGGPAPAAQTGQPADAPSGGAAPPGGALGGLFPFFLVIPMLAIMFFMNRNQQKKQKEQEAAIKVGDQVITQSGLIGKLKDKGDKYAVVEIAPGVKAKMLRTALVGVDKAEEPKVDAKAAEKKADG